MLTRLVNYLSLPAIPSSFLFCLPKPIFKVFDHTGSHAKHIETFSFVNSSVPFYTAGYLKENTKDFQATALDEIVEIPMIKEMKSSIAHFKKIRTLIVKVWVLICEKCFVIIQNLGFIHKKFYAVLDFIEKQRSFSTQLYSLVRGNPSDLISRAFTGKFGVFIFLCFLHLLINYLYSMSMKKFLHGRKTTKEEYLEMRNKIVVAEKALSNSPCQKRKRILKNLTKFYKLQQSMAAERSKAEKVISKLNGNYDRLINGAGEINNTILQCIRKNSSICQIYDSLMSNRDDIVRLQATIDKIRKRTPAFLNFVTKHYNKSREGLEELKKVFGRPTKIVITRKDLL